MEDMIYRQQAIDVLDVGKELLSCALDNMDIVGNDREKFEWGLGLIESYIDDIKDMPSAQPEQKKGKWERVYLDHVASGERPSIFYCSSCNQCVPFPTNFCPACGSDNRQS